VRINATRTVDVPEPLATFLVERFFGTELFPPEQRVQRGTALDLLSARMVAY